MIVGAALAGIAAHPADHAARKPSVILLRVPDAGIQPQALTDASGTLHVVYFSGEAKAGDLYYVSRARRAATFSSPIRVNSVAGSAIAAGSVRGAQLAVGRNNRVHVAWNGSSPVSIDGRPRVPMLYSRLNDSGTAFEPQRDLLTWTEGLDGGGAIAADGSGTVFVAWHATGERPGEDNRAVYVTKSVDDGRTFAREKRATAAPVGACGCCGMRMLVDRSGALHILYRAATRTIHRDATWLTITADGATPPPVTVHAWKLNACPMSTFALAETGEGVLAAWQTEGNIYSGVLNPKTRAVSAPAAVAGSETRRLPSLAVNAAGDRLLAWTERTAWARGGTLAWQLTDRRGKILAAESGAGPVPVWGLVAAAAMPDGSFVVVH